MKKPILYIIILLGAFQVAAKESLQPNLQQTPLSFMENKGQITDQNYHTRPDIQFQLKAANGLTIFVGNGAIHYQFAKTDNMRNPLRPLGELNPEKSTKHETVNHTLYRMDVELIGANSNARVITEGKLDYYENYHSPGTGETGATLFAYNKITYKDIYPNIDWVLYTKNNELKHEFIVRQGGNPADIKLKYGGATNLHLQKDGGLEATTPQGTITEQAPVSYTQKGQKVSSSFILKEEVLSYEVGNYKGTLIIDPSLVWATYFGGSDGDFVSGLSTDASGNVIISGYTTSTNNIATIGAYQTIFFGSQDAFIAKFNASGIRLWGTYYGGFSYEDVYGMKVDNVGNIYLTGATQSFSGIATTGAFKTVLTSTSDVYLAKFSSTGSLLWGTYYGGSADENGRAVTTDMLGNVLLVGATNSVNGANDIATTGAQQTTNTAGSYDMFIVKFTSTGSRIWGTYYGGSDYDVALGVATDANNNVFVTGWTGSTANIATVGCFQSTIGGTFDAVLLKLNSSGVRQWATYMGGSNSEGGSSVAVGSSGNIYITGTTSSTNNMASAGAYQTVIGGLSDGYISKFSTTGSRVWSTYFGGTDNDESRTIALDSSENVYVSGNTLSSNAIATANTYQSNFGGGGMDGYLLKYNLSGVKQWGTYYGGPYEEEASNVTVDFAGNIYISGYTNSVSGIATANSFQPTFGGGYYDGFLAKFDCVLPVASVITGVNTICVGNTTNLTDSVSGGNWYSNNSSIANVNNSGLVTGVASGSTNILYVVTNACGADTVMKTITINPTPTLNGGIDQTICLGNAVVLNAVSNSTLSWNNGVNNNQSFAPTTTNNYIVTATNEFSCVKKDTVTVTVNPLPTINAGNDITVCSGNSITLNASSNSTVTWNNGILNNQSFIPLATTNYIATATNNFSCIKKDTVVVTVNQLPAVNAGTDQNICSGNSTTLTATGALNYSWSGGVVNNQSFTPATASSYVVTGTDANGCSNKDTVQVTVNPLPTANAITTNTAICSNGNTQLSASGGTTYLWSNGDTATTTTVNQSGNYYVIATNEFGCSDTSNTISITQKTLPTVVKIKYNGASSVCAPGTVAYVLDMPLGSTTGFAYQWYVQGSAIPGATDSFYNANTTGSYALAISGGSNCNKYSYPKTATIKAAPTASFSATSATTICTGGFVVLVAPSITGYTYTWLKDGAVAGTGPNKIFKVSGNYTVIAKINGCSDTASPTMPVIVNPLPVASISAINATTFCAGDSCTLAAQPVGAVYYEWHNGNYILDTTTTPIFNIGSTATIKVLVKDANGCIGKLSSTNVKTKVNSIPLASISTNGSTTISSVGSVKLKAMPTAGVFWQWYKNGNILTGSTGNQYTATSGGSYTVAITKLGCTGVSTPVIVTQTSPKEEVSTTTITEGSFELSAYPNPVSEVLTVSISGIENVDGTIQVMDVMGKVVKSLSCKGDDNQTTVSRQLSTENWASGVYFIRYKDEMGRTGTVKIIKE